MLGWLDAMVLSQSLEVFVKTPKECCEKLMVLCESYVSIKEAMFVFVTIYL